ncbi:MAG TPA: peptidoglycan-binding domain-containing protein [Pyrinomonadaceae bacterium]|nr:peptidoglycan-binding domain-containing protein [Pyrinomonadaceae bacterium]
MKRLIVSLALCLVFTSLAHAQNTNSSTSAVNANANAATRKRGPIFRATKDQIKQAQTILKERALYAGEVTGKLDPDTRAALRKFQEAEGLKVTGTLNRLTLEKMSIELTEKQKTMT